MLKTLSILVQLKYLCGNGDALVSRFWII